MDQVTVFPAAFYAPIFRGRRLKPYDVDLSFNSLRECTRFCYAADAEFRRCAFRKSAGSRLTPIPVAPQTFRRFAHRRTKQRVVVNAAVSFRSVQKNTWVEPNDPVVPHASLMLTRP